MKSFIVLLLAIATIALAGVPLPQRPNYCSSDSEDPSLKCMCLTYHPDAEFCKDETLPLPSCCKATEKDSKAKGCICCAKKKAATVAERGMYIHHRELEVTEYAR